MLIVSSSTNLLQSQLGNLKLDCPQSIVSCQQSEQVNCRRDATPGE
ncbi:MAG TPA: hypothetical protein VK211_01480 [Kamptonema sp.]|nr:hypothetical protein [Kamptonema sp.]